MSLSHSYPCATKHIAAADVLQQLPQLSAAREPVVLKNFLHGTALENVTTAERITEKIGNLPILLQPEFVSWSLAQGGAADRRPSRESTIANYLDLLKAEPTTPWMCTEYPTPTELLDALAPWPEVLSSGDTLTSFTFVGGAGHRAHLHYDGDFKNVLLVQVFGHKEAILVPPTASPYLLPVGNFAGVFLNRIVGKERHDFLSLTGAQTAVLEPGDALFMPATYWHFFEYPEPGMSINLRFGASAANTRLAGRFHLHNALQQLAWHFADGHTLSDLETQGLEALLAMSGPTTESSLNRALAIESRVASLVEACAGPIQQSHFAADSKALNEAARIHEANRLYPPAPPQNLNMALNGWVGLAGSTVK